MRQNGFAVLRPNKHFTIRTKMKRILSTAFFATICLSSNILLASEPDAMPKLSGGVFELLSKSRISAISNREITEVSATESKKHVDDGYLAHPKAMDCFDALGYRYTGGRYNNDLIRFRLRCPSKIQPGKKYPLIVWFHGKGESGNDNKRQLAHLQYTLPFLAGSKSLDFFMLVTQCPQDNPHWNTSVSKEGKGDAPFTIAAEIFEHLLDEYPIDKTKISTFGQCSGAVASWMFVRKYPEWSAAVVSISATPPLELTFTDIAISAYNCVKDPTVPIQPMRDYVTRINRNGGNAHLTEIKLDSHDAWTPALSQYKVVAWMIAQKKNSFLSPPPGFVWDPLSWIQVFICFVLPVGILLLFHFIWSKKRMK
jgi:predicted peptidase